MDIELGLTYFGARYYSPNLGRFISPDPLTIHAARGDINPYAYVRGRVYNMVDPLGLEGCDPATGNCGQGGLGLDVGAAVDALRRAFSGGGSGGGGGGLPRSNATPGSFGSASVPFVPPSQYSLPPNIAAGLFQHGTSVGQWIDAWRHPVQNKSEYFSGLGKGSRPGRLRLLRPRRKLGGRVAR